MSARVQVRALTLGSQIACECSVGLTYASSLVGAVLCCGTWRAWEAGGGAAVGKGFAQMRWDIEVLATHTAVDLLQLLFFFLFFIAMWCHPCCFW